MAELFGRVDGTSGGRGGSMHIFDAEHRFMGGYGIVGGNLPIASRAGARLRVQGRGRGHRLHVRRRRLQRRQLRRDDEPGGALELPILFLVENNLYGMGTSVERHSAQTDLSKKAEGYGVPGKRIDGMDVLAVREAVTEGIRLAREERRPTMIEAFTYRYRGHSAADPEVYREREEVEEWQTKDPIESFARRCVEAGVLGEREVQEVRDKAETAVVEAVEFADSSPEPPLDTLYENLYVLDGDAGWYAVDERSPEPHRGERRGQHARRGARAGRGGCRLRGTVGRAAPQPGDRRRRPGGRRGRGRRRGRGGRRTDGEPADARGAARRDGGGDAPRRGGAS